MKSLKRSLITKIKDFFVYNLPDFFQGKSKLFWFFHVPLMALLFVVFVGSGLYLKWYYNWLTQKSEVLNQLKAFKHHILIETDIDYRRRFGDVGIGTRLKNFGFPSKIYDANEREIGEFSEERRIYIRLDQVSPIFLKSLIATEDSNFMDHHGVDYKAMFRAMYNTVIHFSRQGGSGITQQLAKLLFTQREISAKRKSFEMFCAKAIETMQTKEEILLMYVNLIYFGHGANGIEYASKLYFDKRAKDLDIGESSFLAGIILNPTFYSPFRHRKIAMQRHYRALLGIYNKSPELFAGKSVKEIHREFWSTHVFDRGNILPRFVLRSNYAPYVIETVRRELSKRLSADELLRGGYKIYTTIDADLQRAAKEEMQRNITHWRKHLTGLPKYRAIAEGFEGALISIDPRTSQIKAMVGGYEFTKKNQLNRVYQAKRQVGSAFKPIVYLSAIDLEAFTPWTLVSDRPLKMKVRGSTGRMENWEVGNGMNRYMMEIPLTKALEISSNVAVVRVMRKIGMKRLQMIIERALGISREEAERRFPEKVWSLALGTSDMTPFELATVYSALANHGRAVKPYLIRKVTDSSGNILFQTPADHGLNGDLIVNHRESIYLVREMMRKVVVGAHGTGSTARHHCPNVEFVGKTGSSQKHRDEWFVGFNNELCTIVWFGHDKNEELSTEMYGGTVAAPVWGKYMNRASRIVDFTPLGMPGGLNLVRLRIDTFSGLVARENMTNGVESAYFISGTEPGDYSDWDESRRKWFFLKPNELSEYDESSPANSRNARNSEPDEIRFENSTSDSGQGSSSSQGSGSEQSPSSTVPIRRYYGATERPENSIPMD